MGESYLDNADLLAHRCWSNGQLIYAQAMQHTRDARTFAPALEGVYATDANYAESLIRLSDQYQLDQHDVW
jgi:flagellum-specific peptidoglycan hydrolase FlgJ